MPRKLLHLKRQVRSNIGIAPPPTQADATIIVENSGAKHIKELPRTQYSLVLESLRDGITMDALAAFFGQQGWLQVSEKTFKQYLGAFKRTYPELLDGEDDNNLNSIVSKRKPMIDEEQMLEQLIRVQSRRIKLGVDFEIQTSIVNKELHKDINATRDLVSELARLRGKGNSVGRPSSNQVATIGNEARETLRTLDQGEAAQDKLTLMFSQLAPLLKAKASGTNT
jgi:hypothetical protein